jgi:glycosyltransferase involved in cell wall biosynthesis
MTSVVIVDIKGLITKSNRDVLARHEDYGAALKSLDSTSRLYVLSRNKLYSHDAAKEITIIPAKSLFSFFKKGKHLIKSLDDNILLVSGDPWESFLACVFLRKISRRRIGIQVQIHADVGSSDWRMLNLKNRLRSLVLFYALERAEQIRFVSDAQLAKLECLYPNVSPKAVVIPVPIKIDPEWKTKRKKERNLSVAIIGRIHQDRGLSEFVRVCRVLATNYQSLKIVIVGDGPHEEWLRNELRREDLLGRSIFKGHLNQNELSFLWQELGCVVSFAPSEAFGRSAREALVYGVPVLARVSSGLAQLKALFDYKGIWFLEGMSNSQIIELFDFTSGFVVGEDVSELIIQEVESLCDELARSWMEGATLLR